MRNIGAICSLQGNLAKGSVAECRLQRYPAFGSGGMLHIQTNEAGRSMRSNQLAKDFRRVSVDEVGLQFMSAGRSERLLPTAAPWPIGGARFHEMVATKPPVNP